MVEVCGGGVAIRGYQRRNVWIPDNWYKIGDTR